MTEIEEHYNTENGTILIEMRLRTVMQIFNSLDPSPFHEKDLDPDAEAYISEIVQDFPLAQPMKIVIHLPCKERVGVIRILFDGGYPCTCLIGCYTN